VRRISGDGSARFRVVRPIRENEAIPHLHGIFPLAGLVGFVPTPQPNTGTGPRDGTDPFPLILEPNTS
jgi:hypothetical protein